MRQRLQDQRANESLQRLTVPSMIWQRAERCSPTCLDLAVANRCHWLVAPQDRSASNTVRDTIQQRRQGAYTLFRPTHGWRSPETPFGQRRFWRCALLLRLELAKLLRQPTACSIPRRQRGRTSDAGKAKDGSTARERTAKLPPGAAV